LLVTRSDACKVPAVIALPNSVWHPVGDGSTLESESRPPGEAHLRKSEKSERRAAEYARAYPWCEAPFTLDPLLDIGTGAVPRSPILPGCSNAPSAQLTTDLTGRLL
jgi:hypothetical protein